MDISVKTVCGHYEIYVDGEFNRTCDINELKENIAEIEEEYEAKNK